MERLRLITVPEAARRCGVGVRQLRRAIARNEIAVFDIGGWPRLRLDDVYRWLESRRRLGRGRGRARTGSATHDAR